MAAPEACPVNGKAPSADAVRSQLERVLASPCFANSDRLGRFLRFIVEHKLRDKEFKEYSIGVEVFDKPESFDPRTDPNVRVEARRLRLKLKSYYSTDGKQDPVLIELPSRGYVPVFRERAAGDGASPAPEPGEQWRVAVLSFPSLSAGEPVEDFSQALTHELTYRLTRIKGVGVIAVRNGSAQPEVEAVVEGCVWKAGNTLRICAHLISSADGSVLWSEVYDRPLEEASAIPEALGRAIARAVRSRIRHIRRD